MIFSPWREVCKNDIPFLWTRFDNISKPGVSCIYYEEDMLWKIACRFKYFNRAILLSNLDMNTDVDALKIIIDQLLIEGEHHLCADEVEYQKLCMVA